jgi:hypothetical protein
MQIHHGNIGFRQPERWLVSRRDQGTILLVFLLLGLTTGKFSTSEVAYLACIAHKSLEICERCRLWQQNSPATPENSAAF